METKSYRIDPNIPLLTPLWETPIKVLIHAWTLELKEETITDTDNKIIEIDFYKLLLDKIYVIQQASAAKFRLRKNIVAHQAAKQKKKAKLHKTILQGKEQELQESTNSVAEKE